MADYCQSMLVYLPALAFAVLERLLVSLSLLAPASDRSSSSWWNWMAVVVEKSRTNPFYFIEGGYLGSRHKKTSRSEAKGGRTDEVEQIEVSEEDMCEVADLGEQLRVLEWLREQGCPWDEDTCWGAAQYGHLEILQWAREKGCPWDKMTCWGNVV
eukprot:CAMPEP_0194327760 /NCGR_PEP_ID=MMETSP0171-20130528/42339_1 /TAXON_ID=218684 /ORGANISM="Corethron pennatum, Strain L29A3" /LENGTH=155 /DNA_ID=CAMNT_0039087813 /DNA_START=178 /DNA_END=645 /DNA_ORIENTATION=+